MDTQEKIARRDHALDCDRFADFLGAIMVQLDPGTRRQAGAYVEQFRSRAVELRRLSAGENAAAPVAAGAGVGG